MGDNLPLLDLGIESRVKQIGLGSLHTCALLLNDKLKCFGSGTNGQLGSGVTTTISSTGDSLPTVLIDSDKTIIFLVVGGINYCILYDDMITMKCIGRNTNGNLGQGDKLQRGGTLDTRFPNITAIDLGTGSMKIKSLHAGGNFYCVLFENSQIKCFGDNGGGSFAIGTSSKIGDEPYEMGANLSYSILFSPTSAPSQSPSLSPTMRPSVTPTRNPTKSPIPPTKSPTMLPTLTPTKQCDYASAKLCKYDFKCMWKKFFGFKQCVVFECAGLNKGKCGKERTRCKWNKKSSTCDFKK